MAWQSILGVELIRSVAGYFRDKQESKRERQRARLETKLNTIDTENQIRFSQAQSVALHRSRNSWIFGFQSLFVSIIWFAPLFGLFWGIATSDFVLISQMKDFIAFINESDGLYMYTIIGITGSIFGIRLWKGKK